jgi:hypothetical protein
MAWRLLPLLFVLLAAPVAAQTPAPPPAPDPTLTAGPATFAAQMLAGSWALRVEGTVVFSFDLERDDEGWRGTWVKPRAFATDGAVFRDVTGPAVEQRALRGRALGDWAELTFGDARPGAVPDVFRFRLIGPDRAEVIYVETGLAPFELDRVEPGTGPGPWAVGRVYRRDGVQPGPTVSFSPPPTVVTPRAAAPAVPPATDQRPAIIGR